MAFLYDFLYVDKERIASLYVQIFGGYPLAVNETSRETQNLSSAFKANVAVASVTIDNNEQIIEEKTTKLDPHHIRTIDLLAKLVDLSSSNSNTNIIVKQGSLVLMDKFLVKIVSKQMNIINEFMGTLSKNEKKLFKTVAKYFEAFWDSAPILPAFLLSSGDELIGGTLNDKYLSEPITSFYLKLGNNWLENIHIIGIEEKVTKGLLDDENHLTHITRELLPVFSKLIFPENTKIITPIAILRRIAPLPEEG